MIIKTNLAHYTIHKIGGKKIQILQQNQIPQ